MGGEGVRAVQWLLDSAHARQYTHARTRSRASLNLSPRLTRALSQAISNVLYALGELFGFRTGGVASAQPGAMTGSYDEEGADGGLPLPPPDLLEQQQTLQLHQQRQPTKPAQTAVESVEGAWSRAGRVDYADIPWTASSASQGQSAGPGRPVRLWKLSPHPDYPQLHAHCRALAALALRQGLGAFNPQVRQMRNVGLAAVVCWGAAVHVKNGLRNSQV